MRYTWRMNHKQRSIFCRLLEGERPGDIGRSLGYEGLSGGDHIVAAIGRQEITRLMDAAARRLDLTRYDLDNLPGDIFGRLATKTAAELQTIHETCGPDAVKALAGEVRSNYSRDRRTRLQRALLRVAEKREPLYSFGRARCDLRAHLAPGSKGRPKRRVTALLAKAPRNPVPSSAG